MRKSPISRRRASPSSALGTNPDIAIRNGVYSYRGTEIPLYSGEWSYWAVIRDNWPAVAKKVKEMGIQVVCSCVPWSHHEQAPGEYDWTGRTSPQRDLIGFIDLCREQGIYVILRPGPYIYAGWPYSGPPERLGGFKFDRLEPEYLPQARKYIDAICRDVLAPRQITRGGNLIILQADNEPYPCIEQLGDRIGCFRDPGIFKNWLREKYAGDLDRLNRRWRTALSCFDDACVYFHEVCVDTTRPMADRLLPSPDTHIRYADTFEFIGWYAAEIVRTVRDWMREAGIDIPISANSWSPLFADFAKFCEVADIAGMDIYPTQNFQENISPIDHRPYPTRDNWLYNVDIVKMTEADVTNGNVWCGEFQAGVYPLRHCGYFLPEHFRFITHALLARGLKVWNWYLLVTQYNWPGSPINEWGWPNEYYPILKQALELTRAVEPWNLTPLHDVGLIVYKPHRVIDPGNFEAVFNALEDANVSYAYVDLQAPRTIAPTVLVYAGSDWLAADDLARLEAHVANGGTLITFNRAPFRDEFGRPSRLPLAAPEGARPVFLPVSVLYRQGLCRITDAGHMGCKINFGYFRQPEGEPLRVCLSKDANRAAELLGAANATTGEGVFAIGYARRFGKGKVLYIGSNPSPQLLRLVLEQEGLAPFATVGEPRVTTAFFCHEDGSLVMFVINRNEHRCCIPIRLNRDRLGLSGDWTVAELSATGIPQPGRNLDNSGGWDLTVDGCHVAVLRLTRA